MSAPAARAADDAPCAAATQHPAFGPVQVCPLWMPARGSVPVFSLDGGRPREVGHLTRAGWANWFVCQTAAPGGRTVRYRENTYTNVWWARTLSDTGAWGWVSEVHFVGGADDEPDAALRTCGAAEAAITGTAPPAAGRPTPAPTPPPAGAPPSAPAPTPQARLPLVLRDGRSCRGDVRSGQGVSVSYRLRDRWFIQSAQMSMGHPQEIDIHNRTAVIGYLTLRAATCRTAQGWRILPDIAVGDASVGMNAVNRPRGGFPARGWAIRPLSMLNGHLEVLAAKCWDPGSLIGGFKELLSLPIPAPPLISGVLWLVANRLPAPHGLRCIEFGEIPLQLGIDGSGRITARSDAVGPTRTPTDKEHVQSFTVTPYVAYSRNTNRPDH